ncbi:MAG TPA: DUF4013 domain-containing protein [Methanocorpusculum sp.]|nr:DUF4013 domain-containing protein [Methanocorpusculum sp.]
MSISIIDNIGSSFSYAFENTFIKFGRWLGLSILLLIPIASFVACGIFLKIFRDEEPDFSDAGNSFIQGLLSRIISYIYITIPFYLIFFGYILINVELKIPTPLSVILLVIGFIIIIFLGLISTVGLINFARSGRFLNAFQLKDIFTMINKAGWGKYILSYIIILIILFLFIGILLGYICIIPVVIPVILLFPLIASFIYFVLCKFLSNIFEREAE